MTLHYHGTPISPREVLYTLAGRCFCVSFAAPQDVGVCHQIGQSVMLDNGAFSLWRVGKPTDWTGYYAWTEQWLDSWTSWAVIPDVIGGGAIDNDELLSAWPHGERGAPVWHTDEPTDRLARLTDTWPRVCIGSSAQHPPLSAQWRRVMDAAMNRICQGRAPTWLHMLRGLATLKCGYPFASADSTDVARNHNRPQNSAVGMAARWDALQTTGRWSSAPEQFDMIAGDDLPRGSAMPPPRLSPSARRSCTPRRTAMDDDRLREIRERWEKATGGPWASEDVFETRGHQPTIYAYNPADDDLGDYDGVIVASTYRDELDEGGWALPLDYDIDDDQARENATFIAHSWADVRDLLAEVWRLRQLDE